MRNSTITFTLVLVFSVLFSLSAYAKEVVLYSSNQPEMIDVLSQQFEAKTGIKVITVRMGTGEAMKRIDAEKGKPLCDVFWSGDLSVLNNAKDNFAPYLSPEAAAIPESMRAADNLWAATNVHVMVLMVNTDLIKDPAEIPTKWTDLFDPKWKNKVVIASPAKSGTAYAQVFGVYKLFGWQGLEKLALNARELDSSGLIYKGVADGEFPIGVTLEYVAQRYIDGGAKNIKSVYPVDGVIVSPEGAAMIKGCPNPEEAKLFMDFLLSKETESYIFEKYFRRAVRSDVMPTGTLPELKGMNILEIDNAESKSLERELLGKWRNLILNK